jgi:hypothetical protein
VEGLGLGFGIVGGLFDRAGLRRRHDGCHSSDAYWGAQGGAEGREGAAGQACCHRGGEYDGLISISLRRCAFQGRIVLNLLWIGQLNCARWARNVVASIVGQREVSSSVGAFEDEVPRE